LRVPLEEDPEPVLLHDHRDDLRVAIEVSLELGRDRRWSDWRRLTHRLGAVGGQIAPEMVMRMRGLEPPRAEAHTDLNRARLPIPPHPRLREIDSVPPPRERSAGDAIGH